MVLAIIPVLLGLLVLVPTLIALPISAIRIFSLKPDDRAAVSPQAELLDTLRAVETPEGITLDLRLAGPAPRALAWLIHSLIKYVVQRDTAWC